MKKTVWIVIIILLVCLGLIIGVMAWKSCYIGDPQSVTTNVLPDVSEITTQTTTATTEAPPIGAANEKRPFNDDGTGIFFMEMSLDSFKNKVEELGWISYDEPTPNNEYYVKIFPEDPSIYFEFNESNQLVCINVLTENIETQKGLKIGDPESKIRELYGEPTEYNPWEEGFESYYIYTSGNITLSIRASHDTKKVTQWMLGYTEYVKW